MTWGTVGQWVSAVGTSLAFSATFYVIRRDGRVRRQDQARKVAFYVQAVDRAPDEVQGKHRNWYNVTIKNLSDEPLYDVSHYLVDRKAKAVDVLTGTAVLLPDESFTRRSPYSTAAWGTAAFFRDNSGRIWRREIGGRLTEVSPLQRRFRRTLPGLEMWPRTWVRELQALRQRRASARWARAWAAARKARNTEAQK